jgi:lysophospholipase L1-like esterase
MDRSLLRQDLRRAATVLVAASLLVAVGEAFVYRRLVRERVLGDDREAWSEIEFYRPHHHLAYEIRAGAPRMPTRGPHNRLGFRGPDVAAAKPAGTARIVCLGESSTYGSQVLEERDCWPRRLETALRGEGRSVEFVNAGVIAYNTAESIQSLREKVLPLDSDAVVILHGVSDVIPRYAPGFRSDYAHLRRTWEYRPSMREPLAERSALLFLVYHRLAGPEPPLALRTFNSRPYDEDPVAERERFLATPPSTFARNVRTLVDAVRGAGAVAVLATPSYDRDRIAGDCGARAPIFRQALAEHAEAVRRVAGESGAPLVDLQAALAHEGSGVFADFAHHNPQGSELVARAVARTLRASGL